MNTPKRSVGRRLVAALGVAALSLAGAVGITTAANAADTTGSLPGNIDSTATGSLTLHKFEEAGATSDYNPDGSSSTSGRTPLGGVGFTLFKIETGIDLTTNAGWDKANTLAADLKVAADNSTAQAGASGPTYALKKVSEQFTVASDGTAGWSSLGLGAYVVVETTPPTNATNYTAPFVVTVPLPHNDSWLYSVNVYPKNSTSDSTKTVSNEALGLGSPLTYTITVPIPKLASGASFTNFQITDVLPSGFNYTSSSVTPTGAPLTPSEASGTVTFGPGPVTASDAWDTWLRSAEGKNVVLTISGTVTDPGKLVNTASTTVNNLTQRPTATTQWGKVEISKTDKASSPTYLSGAKFQVFATAEDAKAGTNAIEVNGKDVFITGSGANLGKATIDGLWVSNDATTNSKTYYVKETEAPAGYTIPAGNVPDPTDSTSTLTGVWSVAVTGQGDATVSLKVQDPQVPKVELPLTGADGQLLALIGGGSLVLLAAGTALVARKRSHQD